MIEEKQVMRRFILYVEGHLPLLDRSRINRNVIAHGGDILFDSREIERCSAIGT